MKHEVKLSAEERVQAWLDLCDSNLRLMESALDRSQMEERFSRIREDVLRGHREFLRRLGELGQGEKHSIPGPENSQHASQAPEQVPDSNTSI